MKQLDKAIKAVDGMSSIPVSKTVIATYENESKRIVSEFKRLASANQALMNSYYQLERNVNSSDIDFGTKKKILAPVFKAKNDYEG